MVFFTCNGCGEALKKNRVDKHAYSCQLGCEYVTCIDCSIDFWGDDYKLHTSCISENEKYGGSNYQKKVNKGDAKQQEWLRKIQEAQSAGSLSAKGKSLLQQLMDYDNIPRKRVKFLNFIKNSLKVYDVRLGEEIWTVFSAPAPKPLNDVDAGIKEELKKEKTKEESKVNGNENEETERQNITDAVDQKKKKTKKRKAVESDDTGKSVSKTKRENCIENEEQVCNQTTVHSFPWNKTFKICVKAAGGEISLKKLKKKVLAEYRIFEGAKTHLSEVEIQQLFEKKLNKSKKVKIDRNKVKLSASE